MKYTAVLILALAASGSIFGQNAKDIFASLPADVAPPKSSIVEENSSLMTMSFGDNKTGQMKVISDSPDNVIVGITSSSCDASEITFLQLKGGKWSDITSRVLKPIGKKDVVEILKASPATISSMSEKIEIAYFFKFAADTTKLELIARKQGSCDVAGRVYSYSFNGKRYEKDK
jgi:hypothetical protein